METINHECYVPSKVVTLLTKAGFDWVCREYYYNFTTTGWSLSFDDNFVNWNSWSEQYISAPALEVAQKWLRDVKNIDIDIHALVGMLHVKVYVPYISTYRPYVVTESDKHFGITEEEAKEKNWLVQTQFALTYDNDRYPELPAHKYFYTYEEAQQEAIMKALKILAIQIK